MTRVHYLTACTLEGFIADENNSLDWLFEVPHEAEDPYWDSWLPGVGGLVMGATTYTWMLDQYGLANGFGSWSLYNRKREGRLVPVNGPRGYDESMIIRPETADDYPDIAEVNAHAFRRAAEAIFVDLHRHRSAFDPELSLVAEVDGDVIGHALFSPRTIRLMDTDVQAVSLGPIAVLPAYQRQGVGGALIAEGHRVAAAKGYTVCYLVGHATYYPRFGYRTHAYGDSTVTVPTAGLPESDLQATPVTSDDIPALRDLWRAHDSAVDFAIDPGSSLMNWISPNPAVHSLVFRDGDSIIGYVRRHEDRPADPACFLARDAGSARAVAGALARETTAAALTLPIHPRALSADAFGPTRVQPFAAAMAVELAPGPLGDYFARIDAGTRPHGRVVWPVEFDL